MGLCGGFTAWLPVGPLVAAGRMSRAKSNHFPVPRMFCLPQRKIKRAGKGKEGRSMWECFRLSLCHCLSLSFCLSTPLCMPGSPFLCVSMSISPSVFVVSVFLNVCLNLSISVPLFQSLLVSVVLLSLSFLSFTPFLLPPSFLACSSPLPFPSPVPLKLFENRPHRHCYYSVCHPEFVLRNCPLLECIKK